VPSGELPPASKMKDATEKIDYSEVSHRMPLEYWETYDACQGGVIEDINGKGLLIQSHVNMPMGGELRIKVFFSVGVKFDEFQASVKIVGKGLCCAKGPETYDYKVKFISISNEDRLKLRHLLSIRRPKQNCS
jgi:hypothetical protein